MSNNNIFTTDNISEKVLEKLGVKVTTPNLKLTTHEQRVKDLFENKDTKLSVTDIVLGYYNKYTKNHNNEKLINRNYMGLIIYRMTQKKVLKAVEKGVYTLN